jgi:gas vesicle protein
MSEEQNKSNFVLGFLIGSSVSLITTLILHPRSGANTRRVLRKTSQALPQIVQDFSSTLPIHTRHWSFVASKKWQKTLHRFQVALKAGLEASKNLEQEKN